jgi:hypothetical protein
MNDPRGDLGLTVLAALLVALLTLASPEPPRDDADLLARTLEIRLTYPGGLKVGRVVHVWHCRRAPQGCRERVRAFARMFVAAGQETGVSPWLLAAMAMRESGLNPFAVGPGDERGLLQIHPARKDGRRLRFMADERYRERCKREVGACQAEVVDLAARVLRRAIERCGDTARGLAMYNAGRCGAAVSYPRRVSGELAKLYRFAEQAEAT